MSDCSIRLKPRIDDPSNISSLSSAFSSSSTGIDTFLTAPYGSVNCSRTNATLSRRQRSSTSCLSMTLLDDRPDRARSLQLPPDAPGHEPQPGGSGLDEPPERRLVGPALSDPAP